MKIVFLSNFMNHHQKCICDEFIKRGCEFHFIAYSEVPKEQLNLGYCSYDLPYIIYHNKESASIIEQMVIDADVVIFGEKPKLLFTKRLKTDKLTFIFSERLFKKTAIGSLYVPRLIKLHKRYMVNRKNIPWLLCAGAYVEKDFRLFAFPKGHAFKWGYFPEICNKSLQEIENNKNNQFTMLWVGRLIEWKHPEEAINVAAYLKSKGIDFRLKIVGVGELLEKMERLVEKESVADCIEFLGALSPRQVREEMEKAHVLLMTSDRNEGWGAVVNEAMSSACVVVSSKQPGSIPYLLKNGINGVITNRHMYHKAIMQLAKERALCKKLGANAYITIHEKWNHKIAVERLLEFINTGRFYEDGPMSLN